MAQPGHPAAAALVRCAPARTVERQRWPRVRAPALRATLLSARRSGASRCRCDELQAFLGLAPTPADVEAEGCEGTDQGRGTSAVAPPPAAEVAELEWIASRMGAAQGGVHGGVSLKVPLAVDTYRLENYSEMARLTQNINAVPDVTA